MQNQTLETCQNLIARLQSEIVKIISDEDRRNSLGCSLTKGEKHYQSELLDIYFSSCRQNGYMFTTINRAINAKEIISDNHPNNIKLILINGWYESLRGSETAVRMLHNDGLIKSGKESKLKDELKVQFSELMLLEQRYLPEPTAEQIAEQSA